MTNKYVNFISDDLFKEKVQIVLDAAKKADQNAEKKLYSNSIDPFSGLFDSARQQITIDLWLEQEKARQIQKTMQNAIGEFHQGVLGSLDNWCDLKTGGVIDLCNKKKKIIVEVKNKYNTTKGNHKVAIYDDFSALLKNNYKGHTAYYVEIIASKKKRYDKEFTPSDNKTKSRRPSNNKIRNIDGYSFYELATGEKDALQSLYLATSKVISDITGNKASDTESRLTELFAKTY